MTIAWAPGDSLNARASHQHLDRQVANGDALPEDQVGMDTPDAVGAARRDVYLADQVGEPDMADREPRERANVERSSRTPRR